MGLWSGFPFLVTSGTTEVLVLIPDSSSHILERNPQQSSLYKEETSAFYCFPKVDKAMLLYLDY